MTNKKPPTIKEIEKRFDKEWKMRYEEKSGPAIYWQNEDNALKRWTESFYRRQIEKILEYLKEEGMINAHSFKVVKKLNAKIKEIRGER